MSTLDQGLINYFLVVGAEHPPVLVDSDHIPDESKESTVDIPQPIRDIVIVGDSSECPDEYEIMGVLLCDKCREIDGDTATVLDKYPEFYICVSRTVNLAPITDMIYIASTSEDDDLVLKDYEKITQPEINLTPSWSKPHSFQLFIKRQKNRIPIGELVIVTNKNKRSNPSKDNNAMQRIGTTDSLSDSQAFLDFRTDTFSGNQSGGMSMPQNYSKVLNAGSGNVQVVMYKRPIQEYPATGYQHCYQSTVLSRFPLEDTKESVLQFGVASFCFPEQIVFLDEPRDASYFCFALTDSFGSVSYGACYTFYEKVVFNLQGYDRILYQPKCLCILSSWPYFCKYKHALEEIHHLTNVRNVLPIESFITNLLEVPIPPQGSITVALEILDNVITFARPSTSDFPLADYSLLPLFRALSLDNIATILCLILTECKILFQTNSFALLTPVMESLLTLLFPFKWNHPYIPLCPANCLTILEAPVPFLIGVRTGTITAEALESLPTDVYLVDLDKNKIQKKRDINSVSVPPLPAQSQFLDRLKSIGSHIFVSGYTTIPNVEEEPFEEASSILNKDPSKDQVTVEMLREVFLDFFISILRPYRHYLTEPTAENIHHYSDYTKNPADVFDETGFLLEIPVQDQPFMRRVLDSQAFLIFIEHRSFVSDRDEELEFFDKCIDKADMLEREMQSQTGNDNRAQYLGTGSTSSDMLHDGTKPTGKLASRQKLNSFSSLNNMNVNLSVGSSNALGNISPSTDVRAMRKDLRVMKMQRPQKPIFNPDDFQRILIQDEEGNQFFNYEGIFPLLTPELFTSIRPPSMHFKTSTPSKYQTKPINLSEDLALVRKLSELAYESQGDNTEEIAYQVKAQHFCLTIFHVWLYVFTLYMPEGFGDENFFTSVMVIFDQMRKVGIRPDEISYRFLLAYCARNSHGSLARKVYQMMSDDNVKSNAISIGLFLQAHFREQDKANASHPDLNAECSKPTNYSTNWLLETLLEGTTKLDLGDVVLESNTVCTSCSHIMSEEEIIIGWSLSTESASTTCPKCDANFEAMLNYKSSDEDNVNENGTCVYFSPMVLYRELDIALLHFGLDTNISTENISHVFCEQNPVLFWNLIWYFSLLSLPVEFSQFHRPKTHSTESKLLGTNNASVFYDPMAGTMRVNILVNEIHERFSGRPRCIVHPYGNLLNSRDIKTNKYGKSCLKSIEKIKMLINKKEMKKATELFMNGRIRYPVKRGDLSQWFHMSMYVSLLSICDSNAYENEKEFSALYSQSIDWLKPNHQQEFRYKDASNGFEEADTIPSQGVVEFRCNFPHLIPKWKVSSTSWYKQNMSFSFMSF